MPSLMRSHLLAMSVSLFAVAPAMAQTADKATPDEAANGETESSAAESSAPPLSGRITSDERIVVTGTRGEPRSVFESLAPIDVIGQSALNLTASDDILDSLGQLVPAFSVQRLPLADGLIFIRPARLRGLSPDQTLVLVNGKRRHRSALLGSNGSQAPDLAQIPSFSIGRIEVLRDGASAQYGSDAIAGVINIILDDAPGVNGFAQYGNYYEGDGEQWRGGLRAGVSGDAGFLTGTFEYTTSNRTSRSRQRRDALTFQANNPDVNVRNPVQDWGQPDVDTFRLAYNAQYTMSLGELYSFATFGFGEGQSDFNWRNPDGTSAFNSSEAFPDFDLRTIFPGGFTPQFGQDDEDLNIVTGIRSDDSLPFTFDVSIGYGRNEVEYFIFDTINASLGPDSPTSFNPGTLIQSEFNLNFDFTYGLELDFLNAPINIAFGGERREETYKILEGDEASFAIGPGAADGLPSGSNGFPGFSPAQAGTFFQRSFAGYVDLEIPVTDALTVAVAGRYEDFSEFGDTLNGKISARYEITPEFAVRATASTGFRAPTPGQLFSERTSQGLDTETLNIFTSGRFSPQGPVADVISQRDGVTINSLDAEESENYTVGLAWNSDLGINVSIDIYQIDIENRFGTSETFFPTAEEQAAFVELGVPGGEGINRVNFYQNDFDTRTRGIDFVASYANSYDFGALTLTAAYNFNDTEVTGGNLANNDVQRVRFEELLPRHTFIGSIDYTIGNASFLTRLRYFGSWTDFSFNAEGDIFQEFGGEVFVDFAVTYQITDHVRLRAGAENIFNAFPDEAEFQANRGLIYSRNAPYDTDGGFVYGRLDFSF